MLRARPHFFVRYAWGVLAYMLLVILWGAFVRATGSGAGCGSHWPLCNGAIVPQTPQLETIIELSHRLTSALAGFLVIGLVVAAFRLFPRGHRVRWAAVGSLIFVITEGAIGAVIVLFEWVAYNASVIRTSSAALHLVNTFVLVAFLTLTAWWAMGHERPALRGQGRAFWLIAATVLATLVVSTAGAVTALGDTLFRAENSAAVLAQTLDGTAHYLERLRVYHPVLAVAMGVLVVSTVLYMQRYRAEASVILLGQWTLGLYLAQVGLGVWNIFLKAPVWMQLVHLLMADFFWIALILFSNQALCAAQQATPARYRVASSNVPTA